MGRALTEDHVTFVSGDQPHFTLRRRVYRREATPNVRVTVISASVAIVTWFNYIRVRYTVI